MKNLLIIVALVVAVALGGLAVRQQKQIAQFKAEFAVAQENLRVAEQQLADLNAAAERIAQAERKARALQETLKQASEVSADQSRQLSELEQSLANAKTNSSGFAKMFKDPEMKEMIKAQQQAFMGPMIAKNYASFFKEMNLTAEQADYVKELLQQKMLAGMDVGMSMLDGSSDAATRKELGEQIKAQTDEIDNLLKEFLGEGPHTVLKDYEKSLPDRLATSRFQEQLAGSDTALTSEQEQQLLNAIRESRNGFTWTTDYNNQNPGEADFAKMFNEERINTHFQEQVAFDQKLVDRARTFMSEQQVNAYAKFLETQRNMQSAAMKMAAKMFNTAE